MLSFDEVYRAAAVGVVELAKRVELSKRPLREIENEPLEMRRARSMLSRFAAVNLAGLPDGSSVRHIDISASLHETVAMLARPASEWPGLYKETTSDFSYYPLVNAELLVPERIAYDQAVIAGQMSDIEENAHYARLMAAIDELPAKNGSDLYTKARRFIVEGPLRMERDVRSFIFMNSEIGPVIEQVYKSVGPEFVARDGCVKKCGCCGSAVLPVYQQDTERFVCPNASCSCHEHPVVPENFGGRDEVKVVDKSLLTFWVFPGLDELSLFKSLASSNPTRWVLYPNFDEVDIGDQAREVGIDVKSYSRPGHLGASFANINEKEGLLRYRRQIVGIPDRFIKGQRDYQEKAYREMINRRSRETPGWHPEFMTFSQIKKEFAA